VALPTIYYHRQPIGVDSARVIDFMPKLTELLLDAGWTAEWADSDAIGAGSLLLPAWDKTPATSTAAGNAVFRMPANGHSIQWYVRIEARWGGATSQAQISSLQAGSAYSGSGTSVTSGHSNHSAGLLSASTKDHGFTAVASEDGFALHLNGNGVSATPLVWVERCRSPAGVVGDGMFTVTQASVSNGTRVSSLRSTGAVQLDASTGAGLYFVTRSAGNSITALAAGTSSKNASGQQASLTGPFVQSDDGYSLGRLVVAVGFDDGAQDAFLPVNIDGGIKTYRIANTANAANGPFGAAGHWAAFPTA
jgi:hypothetical protein